MSIIEQRLAALDAEIEKLPIRQAGEGCISMREHLIAARDELATNPREWLEREQLRIAQQLESVEQQRAELVAEKETFENELKLLGGKDVRS